MGSIGYNKEKEETLRSIVETLAIYLLLVIINNFQFLLNFKKFSYKIGNEWKFSQKNNESM